ncbi:MAG: VWA domain-containing protein [Pyrinomonadaceae bacterium]|nr:VWA domain-containing protein [Pyrinomonadaceae bacterium]
MRKFVSKITLPILCLSLGIGFFVLNFAIGKAQTTETRDRTSTPTPTPPPVPSGTPPPLPVDDDGIIEIGTELVNLNVRVVDRFNRPIANLRKEDFQVFEDRIPQPIEFFSQSEVPTNYALVIDNSGSLRFQLEKVIEASKTIVNTNRPDDETGVIRFVSSEKIEILQDFTADKTDLNDALDNMFIEGGQTAIIDAIYLAAEKVDEYERSRNPNDRKRRAMIIVSDGEDRSSYYKEEQLFKMLREADVQIYAVGFIKDLETDGSFIRKSPQKKAKNFLKKLATETGGKAYFPNTVSELPQIARDISSELRTQYSIGYLPDNDKPKNAFRNIKVTVKDGPNGQKRIARTRTGLVIDKRKGTKPEFQKTN